MSPMRHVMRDASSLLHVPDASVLIVCYVLTHQLPTAFHACPLHFTFRSKNGTKEKKIDHHPGLHPITPGWHVPRSVPGLFYLCNSKSGGMTKTTAGEGEGIFQASRRE